MSGLRQAVCIAVLLLQAVAGASWAKAPPEREARARELFRQGLRHYNLAEYEKAIGSFKAAYRLSGAPLLLYNIAQAYRLQGPGSCVQAQTFYRSYLAAAPQASERALVERHIAQLEACARRERTAPAPHSAPKRLPPVTRSPSPPAPKRGRLRIWPFVTLGAGAAAVATGALLYWRASVTFDDLEKTCGPGCPPDAWQGWRSATGASYALLAAGGVSMGVGLVAALFWPRAALEQNVALVGLGNGLAVRGAF